MKLCIETSFPRMINMVSIIIVNYIIVSNILTRQLNFKVYDRHE